MKLWIYLVLCLFCLVSLGQSDSTSIPTCSGYDGETISGIEIARKGKFYAFWGWNHAKYSKSDLHFDGGNYDFTLEDVVAKDRQTPFNFKDYFNPGYITIPQFNFRFGYFVKPTWDVSVGFDHMKYVMVGDQTVGISGRIDSSNTPYNGTYVQGDSMQLKADFLTFEHTDGLNYVFVGVRKHKPLLNWRSLSVNGLYGGSGGVLLPKTNTMLLNKARHDAVHFSGFGLAAEGALQLTYKELFFIETQGKLGYINMPDVRTTASAVDHADHAFVFVQWNVVFGVNF